MPPKNMNIFFLDENPEKAASLYCDEHFKIRLEASQMLSTAYHLSPHINITSRDTGLFTKKGKLITHYFVHGYRIYNKAFANHPTSVWVRSSKDNFDWTLQHLKSLQKIWLNAGCDGRDTEEVIKTFELTSPLLRLPSGMTDVPLAMYENIKSKYVDFGTKRGDTVLVDIQTAVKAYREYMCAKVFKNDKRPTWTINKEPDWYYVANPT